MKKISNKKNKLKWILFTLFLLLFLLIAINIYKLNNLSIDELGYKYIVETLRNDSLNKYIILFTNLGSALMLILICVISYVFFKNKKYSKYITINLVCIVIINQVLKFFIHRNRPFDIQLITEKGYSFPSGHSMVSMAFYGYLIYLIFNNVKSKKKKILYSTLLGIVILFIGFSRIYLGVHYTSDVIGGFLFSLAYLIIFISITKNKLE